MSVTRLNHFEAKRGREVELKTLLGSIMSIVRNSSGCVSCQLLESQDEPAKFVILEVWDSVQSHQEAAKLVPPEKLQTAVGLLAQRPSGMYYSPASHG